MKQLTIALRQRRTSSLATSLLTLLAVFLLLPVSSPAASLRFAWLSDTHVGGTTGEDDLRISVNQVNAIPDLDFVILSGDVTEYGSREQLQTARRLLSELKPPSFVIPGNHDTKWSESGATDFSRIWKADRFFFEFNGVAFLGMHQGPLMRMGDGHWAPQDVRWLGQTLKKIGPDKPLIFITHYPVDDSIANWFVVLDLLRQHNVLAVLCGHGHANRKLDFEGIPGVMGRSNLRAKTPGPGFNLVEINQKEISFTTHVAGQASAAPWHAISVDQQAFGSRDIYPRPDFSVNEQFTNVTRRWTYQTMYTIAAAPALADGLAIVGDASGTVTALDVENGTVRWKYKTENAIYTAPAVNGERVFITSTDGSVYALRADSGRKLWTHRTDRPLVGSPLAAGDHVYFGTSEGLFIALDARTGKKVWSFAGLKGFVEVRPLMYDGKVIFGAWDQHLYSLDAITGALNWKWKGGRPGPLLSPAVCEPVAASGRVFIAAPDRFLTAIDLETGTNIWRTDRWKVRETLGISGDLKRIYAREMNDHFHAFDPTPATPEAIWSTNAEFGYDINSAQIIEKDGTIFYGTKNGFVFALNAKTGGITWKHRIGVALVNTAAPLSERAVVLTDFDGTVVRLEAGS